MSTYLSGGRAYGLDLEILKSPSTSWISHSSSSPSSSSSSTLSESSNSCNAISTRKPRTARKRPNQTYNEAAALLSTANPKVFSTKHLTKPCKFTKLQYPFPYEPSDLLLHLHVVDTSGFLLNPPEVDKHKFPLQLKMVNSCEKPCLSPGEVESEGNVSLEPHDDYQESFDTESILDKEIVEGIDSIMGKLSVDNDSTSEPSDCSYTSQLNVCYGYPIGLAFGEEWNFGYGMRNRVSALRNFQEGDWWMFPSPRVNIQDIITPKFNKVPCDKKKKKVEKPVALNNAESAKRNSVSSKAILDTSVDNAHKDGSITKPKSGLLLKLDYGSVLNEWSNRGLPFNDIPGAEAAGDDVRARLAHIDLFPENGGVREASVACYKEKRQTHLFSKKVRNQTRKANVDQRPRTKGRFVKNPNSPERD